MATEYHNNIDLFGSIKQRKAFLADAFRMGQTSNWDWVKIDFNDQAERGDDGGVSSIDFYSRRFPGGLMELMDLHADVLLECRFVPLQWPGSYLHRMTLRNNQVLAESRETVAGDSSGETVTWENIATLACAFTSSATRLFTLLSEREMHQLIYSHINWKEVEARSQDVEEIVSGFIASPDRLFAVLTGKEKYEIVSSHHRRANELYVAGEPNEDSDLIVQVDLSDVTEADVAACGRDNQDAIAKAMERFQGDSPIGVIIDYLHDLGNHDTAEFLSFCGNCQGSVEKDSVLHVCSPKGKALKVVGSRCRKCRFACHDCRVELCPRCQPSHVASDPFRGMDDTSVVCEACHSARLEKG